MVSCWSLVISFSSIWAGNGEELYNSSYSSGIYGIIDSDTTWSDTVDVIGDIVVTEKAELTVKSGTVVKFLADSSVWDTLDGYDNRCDLIILGTLKVRGTISDTVIFTSTEDSAGTWGSIRFKNSKNDTINYTKIEYGTIGCYAESSNIFISKSKIHNLYGQYEWNYFDIEYLRAVGIESNVSDIELDGVVITECKGREGEDISDDGGHGYGIKCKNSDIRIVGSEISKCFGGRTSGFDGVSGGNGIGIYAVSSNLHIYNSTIHNCAGGYAEFGKGGGGTGIIAVSCSLFLKSNSITNNTTYGIGIGDIQGEIGGSLSDANDIYDNGYNLYTGDQEINATHNYWGTIDEAEILEHLYGKVNYSPWTDSTHTQLYNTSNPIYGEIDKDTTWSGNIIVIGDIYVPEGVSLNVEHGTKITFRSHQSCWDRKNGYDNLCDLIVDGKLKMVGISTDSIKLTSSGEKGSDWGSILLRGDNDDTICYSNIGYPIVGIHCENASPHIFCNTIHHCAGPVTYEWFESSGDGIGILCDNNSHPIILRNVITCCGGGCAGNYHAYPGRGIGVLCISSSPQIKKNMISECGGGSGTERGAHGFGILCKGGSQPKIGLNKIWNIYSGLDALGKGREAYGICCEDSSRPLISGAPDNQNDILPTSELYFQTYYAIANHTSYDIIATWNWWGIADKDSIISLIYDHNDDPQYGYVLFEPWAEDSLGISDSHTTTLPSLQVYPNPTHSSCVISYSLTTPTYVKLIIYNALGQQVHTLINAHQEFGYYKVNWDRRDDKELKLPAGIYFLRMETKNYKVTKKVAVLK